MKALNHWYSDIVPWRFPEPVPQRFWKHKKNRKKFFDWLMTELGYKCMDDWYNVTTEDFYKNGGAGLLASYYNSSPSLALQTVYPEHNWDMDKLSKLRQGLKMSQREVVLALQEIFPRYSTRYYWNNDDCCRGS